MVLSLVHLGRMDYQEAMDLQERLTEWRKQGRAGDMLLLVEHPAVLTLGRNGHRRNILADDELLQQRGVSVFETNRGGDVTYHGPGQLVGYPILDLRGFTPHLGAVEYVRRLEEVLIRACGDYGVMTQRIAGCTGVWTMPGGRISEKKIAAIGVHISRAVTSHGFALNVTADLADFELIVPCGIANKGVTSIEAEIDLRLHATPTLEEVSDSVARHFGRVFACQVLRLASLEDFMRGHAAIGENR